VSDDAEATLCAFHIDKPMTALALLISFYGATPEVTEELALQPCPDRRRLVPRYGDVVRRHGANPYVSRYSSAMLWWFQHSRVKRSVFARQMEYVAANPLRGRRTLISATTCSMRRSIQ